MITPTGNYVTNATASSKTVKMLFTDRAVSSPQSFDSSTDFQSAEYSNVGAWFNTGLKTIKAKLLGDWSIANGRTYGVYLGIQRPDTGAFDYIRLGEFLVDNVAVDVDANQTTITMYDGMYTASKTAYDLTDDQFTSPITLQALATLVSSKFEWALDPAFNTLPNYDQLISQNLWKNIANTKYRDVINEIAQATGTTAILRYDDTTPTNEPILSFVPYDLNAEVMTKANLIKFKIGKHFGNLNQITASRMPQNDNILVGDETDITTNGVTNYSFVNNQIMDDDRTAYLNELYTALINDDPFIKVDEITLETEGHGWYEIGDVFTTTIDAVDYFPMVVEHTMKIAGGITETIISTIPSQDTIDRQTAGGIIKHIYNTEIKVDKQEQEITSVVSELATLDDTVLANYTEINQTIDTINQTIQTTGGNNLIQNSVGYATETNGDITYWLYAGTGGFSTNTSPESMSYGAVSGMQINMTGDGTLTQRVNVQAGGKYSFGFRAKKNATGSVIVHLTNDLDDFTISLDASTAYLWNEQSLVAIQPTMGYLDVVIETTSPDSFAITDMRLVTGDTLTQWTQASGEILNTQVSLNNEGIKVKSNVYAGDFVQITPLEFAGYSTTSGTQEKVFSLNRDTTELSKLSVEGQITMPPIKVVPITTGTAQGWAFVKVS